MSCHTYSYKWLPVHQLGELYATWLAILVLRLEFSGRTRTIPRLLMAWLLASPGHQQPWYWLCRINRPLSSLRKGYNHLCQLSAEKWWNMLGCFIALIWMSMDLADDKSTLAQVMACCLTALSHYLSQCWHRSMSPYGITRPQWVNMDEFYIVANVVTSWIIHWPACYIYSHSLQ